MRFDDNRLTLLTDSEFSPYANLQEIYLARNRIEVVAPTALGGLYSLQILDIEGNQLTVVPSAALRKVGDSLRLLNLKGNPIRRLEADSLSGLVNLEEVIRRLHGPIVGPCKHGIKPPLNLHLYPSY